MFCFQIEDDMNNNSELFDRKLQTVMDDNAKKAIEAGKMDETTVSYIAQGISNKAISELRTLLEATISKLNGTLLAQTKVYCTLTVLLILTIQLHVL